MKGLWAAWPVLKKKIASKKPILLLLDYDGTLEPLAARPSLVRSGERTRKIIRDLSRKAFVRIALISGRRLNDLRRRFPLRRLILGGNHGLEIKGIPPPMPKALREARSQASLLRELKRDLGKAFKDIPGVWVQDKRYTLSLHFRALPLSCRQMFQQALRGFRATKGAKKAAWRPGKKVWEIGPRQRWGKEDFARLLMTRFSQAVPIAVGDDQTDEDMFRAIQGKGFAVRVGKSRSSAAAYYLRSPNDVLGFLRELCRMRKP